MATCRQFSPEKMGPVCVWHMSAGRLRKRRIADASDDSLLASSSACTMAAPDESRISRTSSLASSSATSIASSSARCAPCSVTGTGSTPVTPVQLIVGNMYRLHMPAGSSRLSSDAAVIPRHESVCCARVSSASSIWPSAPAPWMGSAGTQKVFPVRGDPDVISSGPGASFRSGRSIALAACASPLSAAA